MRALGLRCPKCGKQLYITVSALRDGEPGRCAACGYSGYEHGGFIPDIETMIQGRIDNNCGEGRMAKYGRDACAAHSWAIFEVGSEADPSVRESKYKGFRSVYGNDNDEGGVIGTSEWIWMDEEWGCRVVAALNYFDGISTEEIERMQPLIGVNTR